MESILLWGLDMIRAVQSHANPSLTVFMKLVTNFGGAAAYLALLPLVFWCYNEEKGIRLALAVMVSVWINLALKLLCGQPRPFWPAYDPSVGIITEGANGFPSGHAQISLTLWVIVASWTGKRWAYAAAVLVSLLVGFSRLYLGVHFPTDLLGGWILGGLVLAAYFLLSGRIKTLLLRGGQRFQMIASTAAAFVMILYRPSIEMLMPGAVVLGMGLAYSITANRLHFRSAAMFGRRGAGKVLTLAGRYITGIAGVVLVFVVLGRAAPEESSTYYPLFFFLRFALLEFWIYLCAPWLYQRLSLAEKLVRNPPDKETPAPEDPPRKEP
ncbi:MAG: phosphatase PAP2 family protein [Treponema sp.]|jgi:membrane-associated phospholipid phosphatase|nr:phosphatase PAP2 family protein [Treponema sp.]